HRSRPLHSLIHTHTHTHACTHARTHTRTHTRTLSVCDISFLKPVYLCMSLQGKFCSSSPLQHQLENTHTHTHTHTLIHTHNTHKLGPKKSEERMANIGAAEVAHTALVVGSCGGCLKQGIRRRARKEQQIK